MLGQSRQYARRRGATLAIMALAAGLAEPACAQEEIKLTVAAGHPAIFLWVKHLKASLIPTVDAELAIR
jgi:TRAP-type transport system periplasmic protein